MEMTAEIKAAPLTNRDQLKMSMSHLFEEKKKEILNALEFEHLRAAYIAKYGYTIVPPRWDDIIHWQLPATMTEEEIRAKKRRQFLQILGSPSSNWMRSYATVMTWLDDIQDASTTVMVAGMLLRKYMPRLLARFVPILGWALLAHDILGLAVAIGRAPVTPMAGKRIWCKEMKGNPFSKRARKARNRRVLTFKPSWGNLIEVLQTTDIVTGIGISLGSSVGYITDLAAGIYRKATGQRVTVLTTPPPMDKHIYEAARALQSSSMINAGGQGFLEEDHHLAHYIGGLAGTMLAPWIEMTNPLEMIENPLNTLIPAARPTNPLTIAVIEEAGYSVEDGVRWPANEEKTISLDELTDWQMPSLAKGFINYADRNNKNYQGYVGANSWHEGALDIIDASDPTEDLEEEFDPAFELLTRFFRIPVLLEEAPPPEVWNQFSDWVSAWQEHYGKLPSTRIATEKGKDFGIKWKFSYPAGPTPDSEKFFPGIVGSWEDNEGE